MLTIPIVNFLMILIVFAGTSMLGKCSEPEYPVLIITIEEVESE